MDLLGIIVAIIFIIFLSMRGMSILIAAPLATIVVLITNDVTLFEGLFGNQNSYISNLTSFILNFFAIFTLGSILGQLMDDSGAVQTISETMLKRMRGEGKFSAMIALFIISAILTYGGISVFVVFFVLVPLCKPIFKNLNITWYLASLPIMLGSGTFTMTMLPGTPSIQNAIPVKFLDTTLAAGWTVGLVGSIIAILSSLTYMKFALNSSERKEVMIYPDMAKNKENSISDNPPFSLSILPLVLLIAFVLWGSFSNIDNTLIIGLCISICTTIVFLRKYVPNLKKSINMGATNSLAPIFMTSSAVAFGNIVTHAAGFITISDYLLHIPGNPLISASFVASVFSMITGSASGSVGIVMSSFADNYLAMGIDPEMFHRIAVMASATFAPMPHSGVVLTLLSLCALTHKQAYFHIFMSNIIVQFLSLAGALLAVVVF